MQPQSRNHLLFFVVVALLLGGYLVYQNYFASKTPHTPDKPAAKTEQPEGKGGGEAVAGLPRPTHAEELEGLVLGSADPESLFMMRVQLDPLGGGVRGVLLNKFQAADADGRPLDQRLELVPDNYNKYGPAFALYHFALDEDPKGINARPLDYLGRVRWEVVRDTDGNAVQTSNEGKTQSLSFRYVLLPPSREQLLQTDKGIERAKPDPLYYAAPFCSSPALAAVFGAANAARLAAVEGKLEARYRREHGITVTRTYSLTQREYHLGHEVRIERSADDKGKDAVKFRYQLAGPRGLPVEGKWYTSTFRNVHVCRVNASGSAERKLQDLRQISNWQGGDAVAREDDYFIRFAAVAVQYFASAIVVDEHQEQGDDVKYQQFLTHATPTLETALIAGKVVSKAKNSITIRTTDDKFTDVVHLPADGEVRRDADALVEGQPVAVVCRFLSYNARPNSGDPPPKLALEIRTGDRAVAGSLVLWEDDVTVRVTTDVLDLEPGKPVTHRYLLYHGPVKPSLLRHFTGVEKVDQALVDRYADTLNLNKMTDSPRTASSAPSGDTPASRTW